jgi:hypothetical protein
MFGSCGRVFGEVFGVLESLVCGVWYVDGMGCGGSIAYTKMGIQAKRSDLSEIEPRGFRKGLVDRMFERMSINTQERAL